MKKKEIIILGTTILAILIIIVGVSLAIFTYSRTGSNQQLVLGEIYMKYDEVSQGISLEGVMPASDKYVLNTSQEAVNKCVEYLYNTYGSSWKGMVYSTGVYESSYNSKEVKVMPLASVIPTYEVYCQGETLYVYETSDVSNTEEAKIKPLMQAAEEVKRYILDDLSNGTLTETDKNYLEENGIIKNTVKDLEYFEFQITGKNTYNKAITYNIELAKGEVAEGKSESNRIKDKDLRFKLVSVEGEEETVIFTNKEYGSIENQNIYTSRIEGETESYNKTYRLYMWISSDVVICGGDVNEDYCDYQETEWNNLFASIKVNVNGEVSNGVNLVEKIKSRYDVNTKQDGLVAVNEEGELASSTDTIREYRYSGIGNYCTYTNGTDDYNLSVSTEKCPETACLFSGAVINGNNEVFVLEGGSCTDFGGTTLNIKNNQTTPTDSGLRNYIKFNNELWRIVGIFKEENGEERIKIVKDTPIENSFEASETIEEGGVSYANVYSQDIAKYKYFYWNNPTENYTGVNLSNWTKAGVMYYLNGEYYNKLSNKELIAETKYYLGNIEVNTDNYMATGTNKQVYNYERDVSRVWEGNEATWTGKIALLYLSDYGYASSPENWSKDLNEAYSNGIFLNNWINSNESYAFWLLSPSSLASHYAVFVSFGGSVGSFITRDFASLLPVLDLTTQTKIKTGTGGKTDPYVVIGS